MADYLLLASRDPYESRETVDDYALAASLREGGAGVTLFLVQNGVLPARARARAPELGALSAAGVSVLADDFSLRERAIGTDELRRGVAAAPLERVLDALLAGHKVLWL